MLEWARLVMRAEGLPSTDFCQRLSSPGNFYPANIPRGCKAVYGSCVMQSHVWLLWDAKPCMALDSKGPPH